MIETYIPYVITEMFCFIFSLTIFFHLDPSIGTEHEIMELRNMIYAYWIMILTDILYTFFNAQVMIVPDLFEMAVDALLVMSISLGCYYWAMFIFDRLNHQRSVSKKKVILYTVPVAIICMLDVLSIFTGFFFHINADHQYVSTNYLLIQGAVNYFYLIYPLYLCFMHAKKSRSKEEKDEFYSYVLYLIIPLICGMLEDQVESIPILALSIFMVIEIMFLMIQRMQIYNDALTNLNNRRRLNQYLENVLPNASPERPISVFMLDINRFKKINDSYGHVEGDNALRFFAVVLKKSVHNKNSFVARYGGDEFCVVTDGNEVVPEDLENEIRNHLVQMQTEDSKRKYQMSVSIGHVTCTEPDMNSDKVIAKADEMLYLEKKKWHDQNS